MKDLFFAIVNIFRAVGKIFIFLKNLLFTTLVITAVGLGLFLFFTRDKGEIAADSILRLDISGTIVEEKKMLSALEYYLGSAFDSDSQEAETALQDILDVINHAAGDERISTMLLNLRHLERAGLNQLQSIGSALNDFRRTGKQVIAAEDYYTQTSYYLAAHADQVILNPMGGVDLHGFGVYRLYFREALDKLQVTYNIFRVGEYKSALEPFTRDDMSEADRLQNEVWLGALWSLYSEDIAREREISRSSIRRYTDAIDLRLQEVGGDTARLALETGLVDQLMTRTELREMLTKLSKAGEDETPKLVRSGGYLASVTPSYSGGEAELAKVALVIAEGNILPGRQPAGVIGGDSLAAVIRDVRRDPLAKALVLRISSPGGSAFASEIVRQEIVELQKSGRPVVVSMGSVAASGGYWIAAMADEIWASPATITGSIGVFGAIPTFEKTLASIGVSSDGTGTTPLAAGLDLSQPLPPQLAGAIQASVEHSYDRFVGIVAEGRKMAPEKVRDIAGGRVYDGRSALSSGLVDKLGSLDEAIASAARLAKLDEYQTERFETQLSVGEQVRRLISGSAAALGPATDQSPLWSRWQRALLHRLEGYLALDDPRGVYAHSLLSISM